METPSPGPKRWPSKAMSPLINCSHCARPGCGRWRSRCPAWSRPKWMSASARIPTAPLPGFPANSSSRLFVFACLSNVFSVIPASRWNSGRHRVENLTALLSLVAAGKGVTLAPAEVSQLAHPQAVFVPLARPVPFIVSAAARRKDSPHSLVEQLVLCCQDTESSRQNRR